MADYQHTFKCIDGHTCGNPVRMVIEGGPDLKGDSMSQKRQYFLEHYDWVRTSLMFEPRGHDIMSGSILYDSTRSDCDIGFLYIETSGCLPMCGHGTIGTATFAIEGGFAKPATPGILNIETPAGRVVAHYEIAKGKNGDKVSSVRIHNVASYLAATDITIDCPELGEITLDVAYGGNYYAIIDPQKNFSGLHGFTAGDILRLSPHVRQLVNEKFKPVHPEDPTICFVSHVLWTGDTLDPSSDGRNAVFYGDKAIDRSPCGTGTSARMAQLVAKGKLAVGDDYIQESIIGSKFEGRVEAATKVGDFDAILPSIAGWAKQTGVNTIFVDEDDPFHHGFQVL
jgi:4-hydroxyproline epimerase